ncbi:ABC transporter ATP-binding protein [candidate division KSB1 bacterium]|nr:ABC transporter ATP-binding protein [candidate division KSB1 bacterium]
MSSPLLEVRSIEKEYESVRAVDGLSFDVQPGEIFALLGPNGAGKTTVVRMLLRILHPDRGTIRYCIDGTTKEKLLSHEVGYLPEDRGLYREIQIFRTLTYMGVLRGMKREAASRAAGEWLERMELGERKNDKLDQLSKGNQQKVQFIASILHRPKFAILDEPFSGLDPVNQEFFLDIIRELRLSGMTILLSAHQMDLVQRLVDRVLLVNRGRAVLAGTLANVRASSSAHKKVVLKIEGVADTSLFERFETVDHFHAVSDGEYAFSLRQGESLSRFLANASAHLNITDIRSETPSLHEIFLHTINNQSLQKDNGT